MIDWSNHELWDHVIDIGVYVVLCAVLIVAFAELSFSNRHKE